ncbi:hypothetical protein [Prescottella equi]|uniref:hypothetical protein n=1 Tax=Rhodococcus hoagii TaxID=43767 RepID=UPI0007CD918F|nr:hypothetical protein [Prescottella equi]ORL01545.1 hypothetical protein A6F56_04290 [Prescottella equi]
MSHHLYRVQITSEPEWEERPVWRDRTILDERGADSTVRTEFVDRVPAGWYPTGDYIENMGTNAWIMPKTEGRWFSRSSAAHRRRILEDVGFTAIIQRSAPIVWPEDGEEQVRLEVGPAERIADAIAVLQRAGIITMSVGGAD